MALDSQNWNRPLANQFGTEALQVDGVLTQDATKGEFTLHLIAQISGKTKVLSRIVVKPELSGSQLKFTMKSLKYRGDAADFTPNGLVPLANAAVNIDTAIVTTTELIDLDAFYTAAGDLRS